VPSKILTVREALTHPVRRQIMLALFDNPGINLRQLARLLNIGPGTLAGHLMILQRLGLVREERKGKKVSLYVNEDFVLGAWYR